MARCRKLSVIEPERQCDQKHERGIKGNYKPLTLKPKNSFGK